MSPRTKEQNEEIRQQSKMKILMAALEIFAEKGYPNASIDQIAKKAGIAKGSIYHYFQSKETILEAVVINGMAEFEDIFKIVQQQTSPEVRLETLITVSFNSIRQRKVFWKLYFSLLTQLSLPQSLEQIMGPVITGLFTFMTQLLEALGVEDAAIESKLLGATIDGAFLHYLMIGDEYPLEEVKEMLIKKYIKK